MSTGNQQQRPQNCGTGHCSCIECVMEPEQPSRQQEPVAADASDFITNTVNKRMDVWRQTTDAYVRGNGAEQSSEEALLRGILSSELECWHRLTEDEAKNLVAFVQNMKSKPAQQQEPVAILQVYLDGGWADRDESEMWAYDNPDLWKTRIVYTSPQPHEQKEPVAKIPHDLMLELLGTIALHDTQAAETLGAKCREALAKQPAQTNWHDIGRLIEAANTASAHGLMSGTSNWAAFVSRYMAEQPAQQQAMTDAIVGGTGVMLGDKRIDPASIYKQPEQEPVAWMFEGIKFDGSKHGPHLVWKPAYMDAMSASMGAVAVPLYTSPPPCKPLTEAQIGAVAADIWGSVLIAPQSYQAFARAIEAAHGIKGDA